MSIDLDKITGYEKLIIEKGLCDYKYIMDNLDNNNPYNLDDDESIFFQIAFYDFYLSARWSEMEKKENWNHYFDILNNCSGETNITTIIKELKKKGNKCNEFSIASKLIHTNNPHMPIYDSNIKEYLIEDENEKLWWGRPIKESEAPRGTSDEKKIEHDWKELCKWYEDFFGKEDSNRWIAWFNDNFPNHKNIPPVKKIDFIIWAHVSAEDRKNKIKEKQK